MILTSGGYHHGGPTNPQRAAYTITPPLFLRGDLKRGQSLEVILSVTIAKQVAIHQNQQKQKLELSLTGC